MAQGNASACLTVFFETGQAAAPSGVLFRLAVGVRSARQSLARVNATALDAGQLSVTFIVGLAFRSSFSATSLLIGVALLSVGAVTFKAAVLIDAQSSWTAWVVSALIDVATTDAWVASVSRLAHAFRRIGRSALAIDSARVAFAGTFAFIAVFRVGVVRRWANAFSRLDAAFVGVALSVGDTADLAGSANALVRIAGEIGRALAVETSRPVVTISSKTAGGLTVDSFLAFVDVFTRAVRFGAITGRAGTVTYSARHRDAFGSCWAGLFASGAVGKQTRSSDDAIRWLTTALDAVAQVAALERIAIVAFRAGTVVTSRQVLTNGPETTGRFVWWRFKTLVDVPAEFRCLITNPAPGTDANAAIVRWNANFAAWTGKNAASRWCCRFFDTARLVRLAFESTGTFADESARFITTNSSLGARFLTGRTLVDIDASTVDSTGETRRAHAFGNVVDQHTFLIG